MICLGPDRVSDMGYADHDTTNLASAFHIPQVGVGLGGGDGKLEIVDGGGSDFESAS